MSLLTRFGYRGRQQTVRVDTVDVSPAGITAGGRQTLPPYPTTTTSSWDCECGEPGDVIVDGRTRCTVEPAAPTASSKTSDHSDEAAAGG